MRGARAAIGAATVFAVAMAALSSGGWWWMWLAVLALPVLSGRIGVPLLGRFRLDPVRRLILRENALTRRENRRVRRGRRRRLRDQRRAMRERRRQAE